MSIGRIPNHIPIDTEAAGPSEQPQVAPPATGISRPSGVETGAIQAEAITEAPPEAVPSAQARRNEMAFHSGALKHQLHRQLMNSPGPLPNPSAGPPGDLPGTIAQSPSGPPAGAAGTQATLNPHQTPLDGMSESLSDDPAREKLLEERRREINANAIEDIRQTSDDVIDNIR